MKNLKGLYLTAGVLQVLSIIFWFVPSSDFVIDGVSKTVSMSAGYANTAMLIVIIALFAVAAVLDFLSAFISSLENKHLYILSLISAAFSAYDYIQSGVVGESKVNAVGIIFVIINVCLIVVTVVTLFKTVKLSKQAK